MSIFNHYEIRQHRARRCPLRQKTLRTCLVNRDGFPSQSCTRRRSGRLRQHRDQAGEFERQKSLKAEICEYLGYLPFADPMEKVFQVHLQQPLAAAVFLGCMHRLRSRVESEACLVRFGELQNVLDKPPLDDAQALGRYADHSPGMSAGDTLFQKDKLVVHSRAPADRAAQKMIRDVCQFAQMAESQHRCDAGIGFSNPTDGRHGVV